MFVKKTREMFIMSVKNTFIKNKEKDCTKNYTPLYKKICQL